MARDHETRGRWARLSLGSMAALVVSSLLTGNPGAAPAPATLRAAVTLDDGTAPFDADSLPGHDSGPNNQIVRTNDNVTYFLSVAPSATVTNTTFTVVLPQGEEMTSVPGVCVGPGSSVTPALPPPMVPTTAASYLLLPRQTLVCNVGTVGTGSSLKYPVVAKVRSEVPNGTLLVLGPNDVTVTADNATPNSPPPPAPLTVSARAQFDVSKDGITDDPNAGFFYGPTTLPCSTDPTRACQVVSVPILISAPAQGRGSTPLLSPITFTDDLSPASLYPPSAVAAANANLTKYGASLYNDPNFGPCGPPVIPFTPHQKIEGGTSTAANSVRDSGTISCTQSGGPGTSVQITIINPDTTAFTCPSEAEAPPGFSLPSNHCYVFSSRISYEIPNDTINDLGISSGGRTSFATTNYFKDFNPTGLDGTPNVPEPLVNNRRNIGYSIAPFVGGDKLFAGIPGNPQNEPPQNYGGALEGPPGAGAPHAGNIPALPGEGVISINPVTILNAPGPGPTSILDCDSWDNSKLWLKAASYPASTIATGQIYPSNGAAVWMSAGPSPLPPITVEYGTGPGGSGAAARCDDTSSPTGWVSDPAAVPGNDPTKIALGVYTGVTRVRVYYQLPHTVGPTAAYISIGQVVADAPGPNGTRVPNWADYKFDQSGGDFARLRSYAVPYLFPNTYDPETNAGIAGDRLTIVSDYVRLKKEVRTPFSGGFVTTTPQTTGGQTVDYRLTPTVNAGVTTGQKDDVTVEDCLPVGQSYLSTDAPSPNPVIVNVGSSPPGAGITCTAGQTYVKFLLPQQTINSPVTPIVYHVRIGGTAPPGIQTNTAIVSSTGDVISPAAIRTATANVQITQPSGIVIDKTALTPLVQVNRAGSANNDLLKFQINFSNLNAPQNPRDVDIIDVLPQSGANGSLFGGSLALTSVTVTAGSTPTQPVVILYSANPVVSSNPTDPSNTPGTATNTYCNAPSGGTPVIGTGACPTGLATVKAVRLLRAGTFNNGEVITALINLLPVGNAKDDVYVNRVGGDTAGLLPVGPVDAPETITAGSFGHLVWWDYNKNGMQDTGVPGTPDEPGIANVRINYTGTDDLGNPVTGFAITDATGNYTVPNLRAGSYRAVVDPATLPPGAQPVYDLDNGINGANSDSGDFTLTQAQNRVDVNFGYRPVPTLSTTTSSATGVTGGKLSDAVTVIGTQGQPGTIAWKLLGPLPPGPGQTCAGLNYAAAPLAGSGTLAVPGDSTYNVGPVTTGRPGCYSWSEVLSGPSYNADGVSLPGQVLESTLISTPPPPTTTTTNPPTTTTTLTPTPPTPGVPDTGAGGQETAPTGGLLLVLLGALGLVGRRFFPPSFGGARSHLSS